MSVRNYYHSLRDNPEERSSHLLLGGSLKSCKNLAPFKCEYWSSKVTEMQDETSESFVFLSSSCFSLPIPTKITTLCDQHCSVSRSHLELTDLHFTFRRGKKKEAQRQISFSSTLLEPESRETENWECDVRTSLYCHICRPDKRNPVQICAYLIRAERKNNLQAQIFLHNILILYRVYHLTRNPLTESTLTIYIILHNLAHGGNNHLQLPYLLDSSWTHYQILLNVPIFRQSIPRTWLRLLCPP